jgi:hypothetical protein
VDVIGDRKHAGWSPGSVSFNGFARETTFWKRAPELQKRANPPSWQRVTSKQISSDFLDKRWKQVVQEGLGDDFTEKKGYEQVRELIGPSECVYENIPLQNKVQSSRTDVSLATIGLIQKKGTSCDIKSPT